MAKDYTFLVVSKRFFLSAGHWQQHCYLGTRLRKIYVDEAETVCVSRLKFCILHGTIRKTDMSSGQVHMYVLFVVIHVCFYYFSLHGYVQNMFLTILS